MTTGTRGTSRKLGFAALLALAAVLAVFAVVCPAAPPGSGSGSDDGGGIPLDGVPVRIAIPDGYMVSPGDLVTVTVGLNWAAVGDQTVKIVATVTSDPAVDGTDETRVIESYDDEITITNKKVYGTFEVQTNPAFGDVPHGGSGVVRLEVYAVDSSGNKVKRSYYTAFTVARPE